MLLTRAPDLRQARLTSTVSDIRIWRDREDANPADDLRDILEELELDGARMGIELDAYGLTGQMSRMIDRSLEGLGAMIDASRLVSRLRLVKSAAEIGYVRRAAELSDDALDAALAETRPGAYEGDILAAMQGAVSRRRRLRRQRIHHRLSRTRAALPLSVRPSSPRSRRPADS